MTKKKNHYRDSSFDVKPLNKKDIDRDRAKKKERNLDNAIRSKNITNILTHYEDEEDDDHL